MLEEENFFNTVYLVRHGNTANQGMLYNLDQYAEGNPIGIDEVGKEQMRKIAQIIAARGVIINALYSSDQRRAIDSLEALHQELILLNAVERNILRIQTPQLRDVDAAATMAIAKSRGGMTMEDFKKVTGGNTYEGEFSSYTDPATGMVYVNESLESIRQRMLAETRKILTVANPIRVVVLGHGDSLRTLIWGLENPNLILFPSDYPTLANSGYLEKGEALEAIFNPEGRMIKSCRLPDPTSTGRRERF